jgi:transcription elongation factor Elf1
MNWTDIINGLATADAKAFAQFRCPECGGRLRVEYIAREHNHAMYIECLTCKQLVRSHGKPLHPPWTDDLGPVAETG